MEGKCTQPITLVSSIFGNNPQVTWYKTNSVSSSLPWQKCNVTTEGLCLLCKNWLETYVWFEEVHMKVHTWIGLCTRLYIHEESVKMCLFHKCMCLCEYAIFSVYSIFLGYSLTELWTWPLHLYFCIQILGPTFMIPTKVFKFSFP